MKYVPLNITSSYSFLQSGLRINDIFKSLKDFNYEGVGLSDNGVLFGLPDFFKTANETKSKCIAGIKIHLDDSFAIYINSEEGYKNAIKISNLISQNKLSNELLLDLVKGTTVILETNYGMFAEEFESGFSDHYYHYLAKLSSQCDKFFLGLEVTNKSEFKQAQEIRKFADSHSYQTIAFPRVLYYKKDDAIILKMLDAIKNKNKMTTKEYAGMQYFETLDFYKKLYTSAEINRTAEVLDFSNFEIKIKRGHMIKFPCDDSISKLKQDVASGLKKFNILDEAHIERAKHEIDVICELGYADYFLIVADYVQYAKSHNILVGPGRGSSAGSLVSYTLGITEVDPLKYDLQFERFLNKARKTMPDIDVDFMDIARDDVINYIRNKYGNDRVGSITTFTTILAKQSLQDVGMIYDFDDQYISMLSKSITKQYSLREAYKNLPTFKSLVDSDKEFLEIVKLASKIEGFPRQQGLHAAGVILNDESLENSLPVITDELGHLVSQYDKDYLEEQGFLKMDFLSISNLTTIDLCLKLIEKNKGIKLNFPDIPYEDPKIFEIISEGLTAGIFQLESSGMKGAIRILKPKEFNDIVVLLSIFRPGPLDNIEEYQGRKEGKIKFTYPSQKVKDVLSSTYGIIIYQEQISKLASSVAGFSPEEADLFRRAVSHKEKDVLLTAKNDFISGAIKNGLNQKTAEIIFDDILKFANYGFNKSHAVVYSIIACKMAYLKHYYPLEFYTSLMFGSKTTDEKFSEYFVELKKKGMSVYSPNINESTLQFIPKDNGLLFPLSFNGVNFDIVSKLIDERKENGLYKDFYDFVIRASSLGLREKEAIVIINSGALDSFGKNRETLRQTVKFAFQFADTVKGDNGEIIMMDIFENNKKYYDSEATPDKDLELEQDALSIMLSNSPLKLKEEKIKSLGCISLTEAKESYGQVAIAGIVSNVKKIKTKKDSSVMAFVKVVDEVDDLEVTIFPTLFTNVYSKLEKNKILYIKGKYERGRNRPGFIADEIQLLEEKDA